MIYYKRVLQVFAPKDPDPQVTLKQEFGWGEKLPKGNRYYVDVPEFIKSGTPVEGLDDVIINTYPNIFGFTLYAQNGCECRFDFGHYEIRETYEEVVPTAKQLMDRPLDEVVEYLDKLRGSRIMWPEKLPEKETYNLKEFIMSLNMSPCMRDSIIQSIAECMVCVECPLRERCHDSSEKCYNVMKRFIQ